MWQIAMRSVGYLSPVSGRPNETLKWKLAHDQISADDEQKRTYVGSAIIVALLFLPPMLCLGAVLVWFVPLWFKAPEAYVWPIRLAVGFLVVNLVVTGFAIIPQSVLYGENLAYKRMGLGAVFISIGGGFTWLVLYLDLGIAGVAAAALASTLLMGAFYYLVARHYTPWFGVRFPPWRDARPFIGLSFWFMVWNLVMTLMLSSDVIILGLLGSVVQAGDYTLTKYAPETTIMIIAMVVFGITPGLGGIIGSGDKQRAARVRGEIMSMSWLLTTALCTTVLLWNRIFIGVWVGDQHYLGTPATLMIVLVVTQFVLIRNDANIIDLTLELPVKVSLGLASTTLGIIIAAVLVGSYNLGVIGLTVGLLLGRSILSVAYPMMIGRFLGVTPSSQALSSLRPGAVTVVLFGLAFFLDQARAAGSLPFAHTWVGFFLLAGLTFCVLIGLGFVTGFTRRQRLNVTNRIRTVIGVPDKRLPPASGRPSE
jgi:O-antigen/teichoic acid export membrane protein